MYALAIWSQGDFKFEPGVATEHAHDLQEQHQPAHGGGAPPGRVARALEEDPVRRSMIPEFVVQENREGQINLNTSEWLILSKIDGQRSIKAIAAGQRPLACSTPPRSSTA